MVTPYAFMMIRYFLMENFVSAQYQIGLTAQRADIQDKKILDNGNISASIVIPYDSENLPVTAVRLLDADGNAWIDNVENIERLEMRDGILYRFEIALTEEGAK